MTDTRPGRLDGHRAGRGIRPPRRLTGRGDAGRARPHRRARPDAQRVLPRRRRRRRSRRPRASRSSAGSAGEPAGPLDGVPTSIKDLLLTRGWPTLRGSRTIDPRPGVGRGRAARSPGCAEPGAVLVGKTTTPEFGWKGVTDTRCTGVTRNPWDPRATPGGSSGGAAAAVALGHGAAGDRHRRRRLGAHPAGVHRHRRRSSPPTAACRSSRPARSAPSSHVGPMTRTVADAALMLDVLAAPDPRDWSALPPPTGSFRGGLDDGVARAAGRVQPRRSATSQVDPEVAALVARRGRRSSPAPARRSRRSTPGFADPVEAFHVLWFTGAAKSLEQYARAAAELLDPGLARSRERADAQRARLPRRPRGARALGDAMGRVPRARTTCCSPRRCRSPRSPAGRAVPAGWPRSGGRAGRRTPTRSTSPSSRRVACPCGFTAAGLPVGLQVVGPRTRTRGCCAAAEGLLLSASAAPAPGSRRSTGERRRGRTLQLARRPLTRPDKGRPTVRTPGPAARPGRGIPTRPRRRQPTLARSDRSQGSLSWPSPSRSPGSRRSACTGWGLCGRLR